MWIFASEERIGDEFSLRRRWQAHNHLAILVGRLKIYIWLRAGWRSAIIRIGVRRAGVATRSLSLCLRRKEPSYVSRLCGRVDAVAHSGGSSDRGGGAAVLVAAGWRGLLAYGLLAQRAHVHYAAPRASQTAASGREVATVHSAECAVRSADSAQTARREHRVPAAQRVVVGVRSGRVRVEHLRLAHVVVRHRLRHTLQLELLLLAPETKQLVLRRRGRDLQVCAVVLFQRLLNGLLLLLAILST